MTHKFSSKPVPLYSVKIYKRDSFPEKRKQSLSLSCSDLSANSPISTARLCSQKLVAVDSPGSRVNHPEIFRRKLMSHMTDVTFSSALLLYYNGSINTRLNCKARHWALSFTRGQRKRREKQESDRNKRRCDEAIDINL